MRSAGGPPIFTAGYPYHPPTLDGLDMVFSACSAGAYDSNIELTACAHTSTLARCSAFFLSVHPRFLACACARTELCKTRAPLQLPSTASSLKRSLQVLILCLHVLLWPVGLPCGGQAPAWPHSNGQKSSSMRLAGLARMTVYMTVPCPLMRLDAFRTGSTCQRVGHYHAHEGAHGTVTAHRER